MSTLSRDQAIATLDEGQSALDALFARLTDEQMMRPATIGGGSWSPKDLLGHVAFWEELASEALAAWRAGRHPPVEEILRSGQVGIDAANARDQEHTASQSLAEVRQRARVGHAAIVRAIADLSDQQWQAPLTYSQATEKILADLLGGILGAPRRPYGHAFAHLPDLASYVESLRQG